MTPEQFAYWLQGYFEITESLPGSDEFQITSEQVKCIREHLQKVFNRDKSSVEVKGLKPVSFYPPLCGGSVQLKPSDGVVSYPEVVHSC